MVIDAGGDEYGLAEAPKRPPASPPPPQPPPSRLSRSRLHNFTFPTGSWGSQRTFRCSNLPFGGDSDVDGGSAAPAADQDGRAARKRPPSSPPEKSCPPPKRSARFRDAKEGEGRGREEAEAERTFSSAEAAGAAKPWNLRTRRAACNAPAENGQYRIPSSASGSPSPLAAEKMSQKRGLATEMAKGRSDGSEKAERRKFSVSVSREEIEQDFLAFKGTKPPRRPKKRPRIIQRQLDLLFPGLWLSEITPETYKIEE